MQENGNDSQQEKDTEYAASMQAAFKKARLGGWPAIISIGGFFAILFRMIFDDMEGYIIVGQIDIYYWELWLFFLVGTISFLPVTVLDAKRLVSGLPPLPTVAYWKKVVIWFLVSAALALLIRSLVYPFMFTEFR